MSERTVGYFSDLDTRVQERGHKPGTKNYDVVALQLMKYDCKKHRGVLVCYYCQAHPTCTIFRAWTANEKKGEFG